MAYTPSVATLTTIRGLREHALQARSRQARLEGLGSLTEEVDAFALRAANPSSSQVAEFLKLYAGEARNEAARALIAKGVSQKVVADALVWLDAAGRINWPLLWSVASTVSMAASAFHGYRRNQSVGWGLWWGLMGTVFPIITPVIAAAQGFGKRRS
jgi:hypothetical protein